MAKIPLRGVVAIVLIDDQDEADLIIYVWRLSTNGYAFRAGRRGERRTIYLHRQLLGDPRRPNGRAIDVDHINGDKLDCRRSNLRLTTRSGNEANKPPPRSNRSSYKGVYFHKAARKWAAQLTAYGKKYNLGLHMTPEDAARAYNAKAFDVWGEHAWLNPVPDKHPEEDETTMYNNPGLRLQINRDATAIIWQYIDPQCDLGVKKLNTDELLHFLNAITLGLRTLDGNITITIAREE